MDRTIFRAENFFHLKYPGVELGHLSRLTHPERETPNFAIIASLEK
jgi:hypothetical protein